MPKKSSKTEQKHLFKYDLENLNIRSDCLVDSEDKSKQSAFEIAKELTKIWLANPSNPVKEASDLTTFFRTIYTHLLSN